MYANMKCRNCRRTIFDEGQCKFLFLSAHSTPLGAASDEECVMPYVVFLDEDRLPGWITQQIEAAEWSKGRINCQHCDSRIGAFDFVSGSKCMCEGSVTPSVHVIKSKVDLTKTKGATV